VTGTVSELEAAAAITDLFLIYEYKTRAVTPSPETVTAFRANLGLAAVDSSDEEIAQAITELIHLEGFTEPTELHEMRLVNADMVAFWRLVKAGGQWKSFTWKDADVPYVAPWLAALRTLPAPYESV
jgi:hypothetical protein